MFTGLLRIVIFAIPALLVVSSCTISDTSNREISKSDIVSGEEDITSEVGIPSDPSSEDGNETAEPFSSDLSTTEDGFAAALEGDAVEKMEEDESSSRDQAAEEIVVSNPFDSPLPLSFTKQEVIDASLSEFRKYVLRNALPRNVNIVFEDGFPEAQQSWIRSIAQMAVSSYPFASAKAPLVVVGTSDKFISETIVANGLSHQGSFPCGRETTYETYCAQTNWAALNYMASAANPSEFGNPGKKVVVAHELFHVWQLSLHGAPNGGNIDHYSEFGVPVWLIEGLANFMGFAVAHENGIEGYQPGRDRQVVQYMTSSSKALAEHIGWDSDPYGIGMAASEYLVASVGLEPTLDIWFELAQGKTFRNAFADATGVNLDSFYERFEKVRSNFY